MVYVFIVLYQVFILRCFSLPNIKEFEKAVCLCETSVFLLPFHMFFCDKPNKPLQVFLRIYLIRIGARILFS